RHARVDERLRLVHVPDLDLVISRTPYLSGVHLRAIHRDDKRVRRVIPLDTRVAFFHSADQPAHQLEFTVSRKNVTDHGATPRSERQTVDVSGLRELAANRVLGVARADTRIADRHRADALRGGEIALEEQRRGLQRRCDIVESEVRTVARQSFRDVHVETEQIANRVAVFSAVQAMDDVTAWIRFALPRAIERSG